MIHPTIAELTKDNNINRYTLVIAAAKSARIITDEYVRQKDYAEKLAMSKESDKNKNIATLIRREYRDDKAVQLAVSGLAKGEFRILSPEEAEELHRQEAIRREEEEKKRLAEEAAKEEAARADLAAASLEMADDEDCEGEDPADEGLFTDDDDELPSDQSEADQSEADRSDDAFGEGPSLDKFPEETEEEADDRLEREIDEAMERYEDQREDLAENRFDENPSAADPFDDFSGENLPEDE